MLFGKVIIASLAVGYNMKELKNWSDVIDLPFPHYDVLTDEMQRNGAKQCCLMRGWIFWQLSRVATSQELADRRRRIMSKSLM